MREALDELAELGGVNDAGRQQMARGAAEVFSDAGLEPQQAAALYALLVRQAREGLVDDATLDQWTRDSKRALRENFGDDYERRLELARQFVRARPELAKMLRETGLGSHPDVVLALAANAHGLRMKPRARKT